MSGYHINEIPKGVLGESSKIMEELLEVMDSEEQNNRIMALVELSDLVGTIICYLDKNYPGFTLMDLITMNEATVRAFRSGERT